MYLLVISQLGKNKNQLVSFHSLAVFVVHSFLRINSFHIVWPLFHTTLDAIVIISNYQKSSFLIVLWLCVHHIESILIHSFIHTFIVSF